jgi:hypothetical protein
MELSENEELRKALAQYKVPGCIALMKQILFI